MCDDVPAAPKRVADVVELKTGAPHRPKAEVHGDPCVLANEEARMRDYLKLGGTPPPRTLRAV